MHYRGPANIIGNVVGAISPDPMEIWPAKQDVNDIKDMIRLTPDQMKKGYPSSLIGLKDLEAELQTSQL